jgi:hypothetical protein
MSFLSELMIGLLGDSRTKVCFLVVAISSKRFYEELFIDEGLF